MEIRCRCPSCTAKFKVDGKYAGKKARCPKCQTVVEVPLESADESTQSFSSLNINPAARPATTSSSSRSSVKKAPAAPLAPMPPMPGAMPSLPDQEKAAKAAPADNSPLSGLNLNGPRPATTRPIQPAASQSGSTKAGAAVPSPAHLKPASKSPAASKALPFILAGGMAGITVLALGLVVLLINWQPGKPAAKKGPGPKTAAAGKTTLHIQWPEPERDGAMLSIDGKFVSIDKPGELKVSLKPGWHRVYIQRTGYEAIDEELMVAQGQTRRFTPDWKAVSAAVIDLGGVARVGVDSGDAVVPPAQPAIGERPVSIPGFEGWLPSVFAAQQQAKAGGKDTLLLVFGAAYHQPATRQLGAVLKEMNATETYGCVVINFERTPEGFGLSDDSAQNQKLFEDYGIDRLPVLVLADADARPFFIKRDWDDGLGTPKAQLSEWLKMRDKRDELLAAAKAGEGAPGLPAAEAATKWLQDNDVWRFYGEEFGQWLALAERADPTNAAGELEKFFEPAWLVKLVDADKDDARAIAAATAQLDPWIERKFQDPDRAVRLFMLAAQMLMHVERKDDAARHMAAAVTYEPKDEQLATVMKGLKYALENKDVLGSGTGFFISPAGYILTNQHVIDGPGKVEVRLPGEKETVPAEIVAQDKAQDIALLKVDLPDPAKVQQLAVHGERVARGEEVAAFGFPLTDIVGSTLKFTRGFVSADPDESSEGKYVLDLLINPGNSGGPLCDPAGRVVGMITAKTRTSTFEDSYALAIPSASLVAFLDEHLPASAPQAKPAESDKPQSWAQVDRQVSGGVVMIVKKR